MSTENHGQTPEQAVNTGPKIYALGVESYNTYPVPFRFSELIFPEPDARTRKGGPKPRTSEERLAHFLSLIGPPDPVTGCREWQGARLKKGYGQFHGGRLHGKCIVVAAHRAVYELAYGILPDELHIRHKCDNPPCCELSHLLSGTPYDNFHDAIDRGRMPRERKGSWVIDPSIREQVLIECLTGPRGTTARWARQLGISIQTIYLASQRYMATHGRPGRAA
jgi:hypothetical protein